MPDNPLTTVKGPIDGNVFAIIGVVSKALKQTGYADEAKEFETKAFNASSYNEVLVIASSYVNFDLLD